MFGLRKTLGSLFLVVVFLALASLATFFYNTDQENKDKIVDNEFVQKSEETIGTLLGVSEKMTEVNVEKNIGVGKTMADFIARVNWRGLLMGTSTESVIDEQADLEAGSEVAMPNDSELEDGSWSKFSDQIKEEWERGREGGNLPIEIETNELGQGLFAYQKTELGAELIFTGKSGAEYKLPLPFKFLSR